MWIKQSTEEAFRSTVQGYTSVVPVNSIVNLQNGRARYALYPVWILNTKWNDQTFTFAINGQTGKLTCDVPADTKKSWLWGGGVFAGVVYADGKISVNGARKAAKFVSMCDSFNIPVLTLVDSEGVACDKLEADLGFGEAIFDEVNVAIGISRIFHSPDFLNKAFCEARTATLTAFFRGYKRIFITEAGQKNIFSLEHNARKCYCDCLEKLNIMQASSYLDDYFVYLSNCDVQNISDIRDDLLQLTLDLNKKLANPPSQLISEFVNEAATLEDLHHYIQQLLTLYLSEIENKNNYSKIVYEAEKYITNHLSDTLTVKEIADHVFVSPTYLCFLYKKQTGKTLKQFILDIRMQKAKALLLDTNMKIGDIAASLGYMNQNYFTRIFTSYYGTTPSIFRNKNYSYKNTED